jgi:hypothetical protein
LLVSKVASLPEVVSGKVNFCNPDDPQTLVDGAIKFYKYEHESIPDKVFSWEENIEKTLKIYTQLI